MTPTEMDEIDKLTKPLVERNERLTKTVVELTKDKADLTTMLESACLNSRAGIPFSLWHPEIQEWFNNEKKTSNHA